MKATLSIEDDECYAMILNIGAVIIEPSDRLSQFENGDTIEVDLKCISDVEPFMGAEIVSFKFEISEDDLIDFVCGCVLKIESGSSYAMSIQRMREIAREKYL